MSGALSLRPGDRVPDFILPGLDGKLRKFVWSFTGKPVALVVADDLKTLDPEQFAGFASRCGEAQVGDKGGPRFVTGFFIGDGEQARRGDGGRGWTVWPAARAR